MLFFFFFLGNSNTPFCHISYCCNAINIKISKIGTRKVDENGRGTKLWFAFAVHTYHHVNYWMLFFFFVAAHDYVIVLITRRRLFLFNQLYKFLVKVTKTLRLSALKDLFYYIKMFHKCFVHFNIQIYMCC